METCKDTFKTFFSCITKHADYYQPFLEMFDIAAKEEQAAEERVAQSGGGAAAGAEAPKQ